MDGWTDGRADKPTDRHTDRQTDRQTNKQSTDRQTMVLQVKTYHINTLIHTENRLINMCNKDEFYFYRGCVPYQYSKKDYLPLKNRSSPEIVHNIYFGPVSLCASL